ncbi:MAG: OmpH family outer membrane protein [Bacteroidales bacterium]|nr:OmpH family outer membrane protein [Bacteroidales bacterium]
MKKINLVLNIISLAAVVVLFVLHFTSPKNSETTPRTVVETSNGGIVYIRLDSVINAYDMYNDLRITLEGKVSSIENEINKKGRALENDIKSFQEKMGKGLLTRSQAETMSEELQRRQQELQLYSQQKQMEIAEEENVMINQVMNEIRLFVASYNSQNNYSLILTTTEATNTVISGESALDISKDIIEGLNKEYIKKRNK